MSHPRFEIQWRPREFSLAPVAVAARGQAALRIAKRLLEMTDETLSQLTGVAGKQLIVAQGAAELLPWADGVQYLGTDSSAPTLLLPTNYQPSLPPPLLVKAIQATSEKTGAAGAIAVLLNPIVVVPMLNARPVCRETLLVWLEQQ